MPHGLIALTLNVLMRECVDGMLVVSVSENLKLFGVVCAGTGDAERAKAAYDDLRASWRDGDEDLPTVKDVRSR